MTASNYFFKVFLPNPTTGEGTIAGEGDKEETAFESNFDALENIKNLIYTWMMNEINHRRKRLGYPCHYTHSPLRREIGDRQGSFEFVQQK